MHLMADSERGVYLLMTSDVADLALCSIQLSKVEYSIIQKPSDKIKEFYNIKI